MPHPRYKTSLGLDLGTHCGWAMFDGVEVSHGVWRCGISKGEHRGMRLMRLFTHLNNMGVRLGRPDIVYFEDVKRHNSHLAREVYFGLLGIVMLWASQQSEPIPMIGLGVGKIKKFATGSGNAKKEQMIAALPRRFHGVTDDNEADAIHTLIYGRSLEISLEI